MLRIGQANTTLKHDRRNVALLKRLNESYSKQRERRKGEREMAIVCRIVVWINEARRDGRCSCYVLRLPFLNWERGQLQPPDFPTSLLIFTRTQTRTSLLSLQFCRGFMTTPYIPYFCTKKFVGTFSQDDCGNASWDVLQLEVGMGNQQQATPYQPPALQLLQQSKGLSLSSMPILEHSKCQ